MNLRATASFIGRPEGVLDLIALVEEGRVEELADIAGMVDVENAFGSGYSALLYGRTAVCRFTASVSNARSRMRRRLNERKFFRLTRSCEIIRTKPNCDARQAMRDILEVLHNSRLSHC